MDNDPKSYRVPILHLKDVLGNDGDNKDGDGAPAKKTTSNPRETSSETFPVQYIEETKDAGSTTQVFEEDIEAAVITPVQKRGAVEEKKDAEPVVEKPKKLSESTPPQKIDLPAKESGVENVQPKVFEKQGISNDANDTPKQKETYAKEVSKPIHETHIEIEKEKQPTSEIPITKSAPESVQGTSSFDVKETEERNKEEKSQTPFEKKEREVIPSIKPFLQNEKKEEVKQDSGGNKGSVTKIVREINPPATQEKVVEKSVVQPEKKEVLVEKMSKEKLSASMLDDSGADSIFSLIEDTLQSEAKEEASRVEKAPEPEAFIEKVEIQKETPRKMMPRTPPPEMLDIWEQDAVKPRVPYHPKKPVLPTPATPNTSEKKDEQPVVPTLKPPSIEEKKDEVRANTVPETIKSSATEPEGKVTEKPKDALDTTPVDIDKSLQKPINKKTGGFFDHKKEDVKTQSATPETKTTPIEVMEVTDTRDDSNKAPLQRLKPKEKKQKVPDEKTDTPKPSTSAPAGLSNLSALRDRVLKESHLHDSVNTVQVEEGLAKKRQKDLVQTDLHKLDSISKTIDTGKSSVDADSKEPHQFASKHAQAVANIANRMQEENKDPNAVALENAVKLAQSLEVDGDMATLPKIKVLGALEGDGIQPTYKTPESSVPMIRTFRQDVEQAVTRNRTSMVDMITAEQKRRENGEMFRQAPRQETSSWSYVFIGASLVLVIGALAVGAFLFFRLATKPPSEIIPERIPINETISYDTTGQTKNEILSGLVSVRDALHSSLGSVTEIQLTERKNKNDDISAKSDFVTTSSFLQRIESRAPGNLIRSLNDSMVLGVHELRKNEAFIVFTALTYDEAFSGMFEWESSMNKDLSPLFGMSLEAIAEAEYALLYKKVTVSTSTATSTGTVSEESQMPALTEPAQFEDMFVANIPVRGLKNTSGETVLMWSMPDEITIVITTNESTMRMILEYMSAKTF